MTDQEMFQYLVENYHYFEDASKLYPGCNSESEIDKEQLATQLNLLYLTCNILPDSDSGVMLVVYTENETTNFYKGFIYNESSTYKDSVWSGDLNKKPKTYNIHHFKRHIPVSEDDYYKNWYIFTYANTF